jgi:hypothetical protein
MMRDFPILAKAAAMAAVMVLLSACSSERNGADSAEIAFADKIITGGAVVTVDDSNPGAWSHFEEDKKGSIEVGKLADLVILSDNPLTVDPMQINQIRVLETIKEGQTVYRALGDGAH